MDQTRCLIFSSVAMKKVFFLLMMSLATMFAMTSCNPNVDHPISGHKYGQRIDVKYGGEWHHQSVEYTFHTNGQCTKYFYDSDLSFKSDTETHLRWDVNGSTVIVTYDKSTYWKSSARGTESCRFTYDGKRDVLVSGGSEYTHIK